MFAAEDASSSLPSDLLSAALNESGLTGGKSDSNITEVAVPVKKKSFPGSDCSQQKINIIRLPITLNKTKVISSPSTSMCCLTESLLKNDPVNNKIVKSDTVNPILGNDDSLKDSGNPSVTLQDSTKIGKVISKPIVISGSSTALSKTTTTYARVTVGGKKLLIPIIGKNKFTASNMSSKSATNAPNNRPSLPNYGNTENKNVSVSKLLPSSNKQLPGFNLGSLFVETAEKAVIADSKSTVFMTKSFLQHKNNQNCVERTPVISTCRPNTYYRETASTLSPVKDILTSLSTLRSQSTMKPQVSSDLQDLPDVHIEKKHDTSLVKDTTHISFKRINRRPSEVSVEDEEIEEEMHHASTYAEYKPRKLKIGLPHPDRVVETSSLSSVPPPDIFYNTVIPQDVIDHGMLSSLQLETICYACQKHTSFLQSGERAGFLIGDGAGVGKGRTIAGIIHENYLMGRKRALWFSVSNDLKYDCERDLRDIGASNIHVHMLNKFKYGKISSRDNCSVKKGVIFATYSSLIGESHFDSRYGTRLKQLLHWCGRDFDGVIVFDECHKAKNLIPSGSAKPTKTGYTVLELQKQLPNARVIYSSATGASEPRNMAYMSRLGLWGLRTPFFDFMDFIQAVEKRGVGAMELVAMDLKSRGAYIARQLSFHGVSFKIEEVLLTNKFIKMYNEAVRLWVAAKEAFQVAALLIDAEHHMKKTMWGQFWAAHQRFFKYLCIAAKVDHASQLAREAVKHGKCVVIGLQSTGEARTLDLLEKYGELDDFVSTAKGVFQSLIENHFPAPNRERVTDLFGSDFYNNGNKSDNKKEQNKTGRKRPRTDDVHDMNIHNSENRSSHSLHQDTDSGSDKSESDESFICSDEDIGRIFGGGSESEEWGGGTERKNKKKRFKGSKDTKRVESQVNHCTKVNDIKSSQTPENESEDPAVVALISSDIHKQKTELQSLNEPHQTPIAKAQALKKELLEMIDSIGLPNNTLDELIDALGGPENVAEMTGRKGRIVATDEGNIKYETRTENDVKSNMLNLAEKQRFMDGTKNIAIISEAASSGISLQSDRRARNQRRRLHLTLELPWSADRAIQQFGRTHRSNQVSAPEYIFLISELAGEQRFASVVAKRLESLGALTHGDRRATETRDLSQYNFDNKFGRTALDSIMKSIAGLEIPLVQPPSNYPSLFFRDMRLAMLGVGLISYDSMNALPQLEKDYNNILKFMNRILGMEVLQQNAIFQFFSNTLSAIVQKAKTEGQFDQGIVDVGSKEDCVEIIATQCFQLRKSYEIAQKADDGFVELHTLREERGFSWENALHMFSQIESRNDDGFYITQSKKSKCMAVLCFEKTRKKRKHSSHETDEVTDNRRFQLYRPNIGKQVKHETLTDLRKRYKKVEIKEAEKWWKVQYQASSDVCSHEYWLGFCNRRNQHGHCDIGKRRRVFHVLSGSVLSVWKTVEHVLSSKMPLYKMQIVRFKTQGDGRLVGLLIPSTCVEHLTRFLKNPSTFSTPSNLYFTEGQKRIVEPSCNNIIETMDAENSSGDDMNDDFSPDDMNSLVLFSNKQKNFIQTDFTP